MPLLPRVTCYIYFSLVSRLISHLPVPPPVLRSDLIKSAEGFVEHFTPPRPRPALILILTGESWASYKHKPRQSPLLLPFTAFPASTLEEMGRKEEDDSSSWKKQTSNIRKTFIFMEALGS